MELGSISVRRYFIKRQERLNVKFIARKKARAIFMGRVFSGTVYMLMRISRAEMR